MRVGNEFRVGLLSLLVLSLVAWGILRVDDKPGDTGQVWHVIVDFPTVEGVFVTTPVRVAGVTIGSVEGLELVGNKARLTLGILGHIQLPTDSVAGLKAEGMLGDKSIRVIPGVATTLLQDGDAMRAADMPPDIEGITRQVSSIAEDVKAITGDLRVVTGDDAMRVQLLLTVQNVRALSEELRLIAGENRGDIAVIAENLRRLSEALNRVVATSEGEIQGELATVREATASLERAMRHVESITAKVDAGEGTVGRLLNDETTIDRVDDTLDTVGGIVGDLNRIRTEVYYRGDYYLGTEPTVAGLDENPTAGSARNGVGARFMPAADHWYQLEVVGGPHGNITSEEHYYPELGTSYEEVVIKPTFKVSFQFARRWRNLALRFGVKESSGGLGVDWYAGRDKVQFSADLYDFTYGSYPLLDGTPNLQLTARYHPSRHLYVEGGMDNVIFNTRYGFATGYLGGGFSFNDDDLKYVLGVAPVKP
jgi:phospholipid/cholesterol/gamma-HCH transport system substrate-binding protein